MKNLRTKVCGLTRAEDVRLCASLGVDFTGFIFIPSSPRAVTPLHVAGLPDTSSQRVGVFAGATVEEIQRCARLARLDFYQLHGAESAETCQRLGPERVIKVLWPQQCSPDELVSQMRLFAPVCAFFLLDAGKSGGSGQCLEFSSLSALAPPRPWFLAGGLGPHSLCEALSLCGPDGVDLNSAIEQSPGVKDSDRLRKSVEVIRQMQKITPGQPV